MGYTTEFEGKIEIDPPLSEREIEYLKKFAGTRRMDRAEGPYFVEGTGPHGQGRDKGIRDYNRPPEGQPGLWCQWVPTEDGSALEWDEGEKFYDAAEWMAYLRTHFLSGADGFGDRPAAALIDPKGMGWLPGGHQMRGTIMATGEEDGDVWRIVVRDEGVFVSEESELGWGAEERVPDFASPEARSAAEAGVRRAAGDAKTDEILGKIIAGAAPKPRAPRG